MNAHDTLASAIGLTPSTTCAVVTKADLAAALTTLYDLLSSTTSSSAKEPPYQNLTQLSRTCGVSIESVRRVLSDPRTLKTVDTRRVGTRTYYSLRDFRRALSAS